MSRILSCDWGSSSFRLRLVDTLTKKIHGEVISDQGIAETHRQWLEAGRPGWERPDFYRAILTESIARLPERPDKSIPLILSGMASSSIGLKELPYNRFPFRWNLKSWITEKIAGDEILSHPVILVSGFQTEKEIMRGEETKLLGCDIPDEQEKTLIFPGTHSKHVFVKNKTAQDFKTYMTGELFTLMSEKSVLRHAVEKGIDEKSFIEGVKAGKDGNILHELFKVRTRQILQDYSPVSNYQWLSGLLIGTELRELKNPDLPVYLVCGENLRIAYWQGLEVLGFESVYLNADEMLTKGHCKMAEYYL